MTASVRPGAEPLALTAAALAAATTAGYVWLVHSQGNSPLAWVLAVLTAGVLPAGYRTVRNAPLRRAALPVAGVALAGLGLIAILSIGLPIVLAGALALASMARGPRPGA